MKLNDIKFFSTRNKTTLSIISIIGKVILIIFSINIIFFLARKLIPSIGVDLDHIYDVSNLVKNNVFETFPEIDKICKPDDMIFTFYMSTSKRYLSGDAKGKEEGVYYYKIKGTTALICVNWTSFNLESITITKILKKDTLKEKTWTILYK